MVLFLRLHSKKLLLLFSIMLVLSLNFLPQTKQMSQSYIDESLQRSLISFTLAKSLNALISVAQGTQVAATPAGLGVNFAVGEILDPINDMVERFSWVMLASSVSLGIQKVLLALVSSIYIQFLLLFVSMLFIYAFFAKKEFLSVYTFKFFLFILILRFSVPLFALANQSLYNAFLSPSYTQATQSLEQTTLLAEDLQKNESSEDLSMWGKIKQAYKSTAQTLNVKNQIQELTKKLNDTFSHMLSLITLFIIETMISPLVFLYLLLKLFKSTGLSRYKSEALIQFFRDKVR